MFCFSWIAGRLSAGSARERHVHPGPQPPSTHPPPQSHRQGRQPAQSASSQGHTQQVAARRRRHRTDTCMLRSICYHSSHVSVYQSAVLATNSLEVARSRYRFCAFVQRGGAAQKLTSLGGTVFPAKNFNADDDVTKIHEAMQGWGTDEEPLIDVLAFRSNAQRQQIRAKYPNKYNNKVRCLNRTIMCRHTNLLPVVETHLGNVMRLKCTHSMFIVYTRMCVHLQVATVQIYTKYLHAYSHMSA